MGRDAGTGSQPQMDGLPMGAAAVLSSSKNPHPSPRAVRHRPSSALLTGACSGHTSPRPSSLSHAPLQPPARGQPTGECTLTLAALSASGSVTGAPAGPPGGPGRAETVVLGVALADDIPLDGIVPSADFPFLAYIKTRDCAS